MKLLRTTKGYNKSIVVLFSSNYARILVNPKGYEFFKRRENAVCNPSINTIKHIPLQYWKKTGDNVTVMTESERSKRDREIMYNGIDSNFGLDGALEKKKKPGPMFLICSVLYVIVVLYLFSRILHG